MDLSDLILVGLAFAAGGILKGAVGAGAPLLAVPLMALLRDVQFAVAVFVLPNIVPNLLQFWQYRKEITDWRFATTFAMTGGIGAAFGTIALAGWRPEILEITVALSLIGYIAFRFARPAWQLSSPWAGRLAGPLGLAAGALQGASGLSAPISLSFLNAVKLDRPMFIGTIALFFIALGVGQLPVQLAYGIMTPERLTYSVLSLLPLIAFMPVGAWIGRRVPRVVFDRLILALLTILAMRLLWSALG